MQNNLKIWRSKMGLTQEELAQDMGMSRWTIIHVENGKLDPSAKFIRKALNVLRKQYPDVSFEDIFLLEPVTTANTTGSNNQHSA